ncbi:MAG: heterocyst frequency control protein PatD [Cyanobacteria bacterium RM1_2_2]|nr:heterocyst frequency control protein PatD [Cyanobacteria bacterium RM1_2_2]
MMLSEYRQSYQRLEQLFQQLQIKLTDPAVINADLKADLAEVQQIQQQIISFQVQAADEEANEETSSLQAQSQPIQTEVTKQLRLLETDLLFLQSARQAATVQQHKQRIYDRLTLLLRYCAAILALE